MKYVYIDDYKNRTPAKINITDRIVKINYPVWCKIKNYNIRVFILLHELGHYYRNVAKQTMADEFAMRVYIKRGYPLRDLFFSLLYYVAPREALERIRNICHNMLV